MSGQIVHLEPDAHAAVQQLLPWYLTGRLEQAELDAVEAHLAQCAECRAELQAERQWQLLQPAEASPANVEDDWARMRARIDAEASPPQARAPLPARRRRAWAWPAWPAGARLWAAPGLLSVALLLAIVVTLRPGLAVDEYHALAAPAELGATAVVRFKPDATEAQIRQGLKDSGARFVDGPTVSDAYVVRLRRDNYTAALDRLRKAPGVALVEALESASP